MPAAIPRLSGLISQAPGSEDRWRDLLIELGATFRANFSGFVHFEQQTNSGLSLVVTEDPRAIAEYDSYYNSVNPWILRGAQQFKLGSVLPSEALVPYSELEQTEFYNDFLRKYSFHHSLGACINLGSRTTHLTLGRARRDGAFLMGEVRLLGALAGQIRNAIAIDRQIAAIRAAAASVIEDLDQLGYALLIMRDERVLFANAAARALETLRLYELTNGLLRFHDPVAQSEFLRRQDEAAKWLRSALSPISTPFTITSQDRRRFRVTVALAKRPAPGGDSTGVFVIVEEVRSIASIERKLSRTALSNREREIAMLVIKGHDPTGIERALSIAPTTVRLHLKRIYRKLDVSGYVELRRRYGR